MDMNQKVDQQLEIVAALNKGIDMATDAGLTRRFEKAYCIITALRDAGYTIAGPWPKDQLPNDKQLQPLPGAIF